MNAPKHTILVALTTLLAIGGVGYWYYTITTLSVRLAEAERELRTQGVRAPHMATDSDRLALEEAAVGQYFVNEDNVPGFINALEARVRAQGATISIASVSRSGTATEPALALALTVTGSFEQVMRTVGSIEYIPYATKLTSVNVVYDPAGTWRADVRLSVGLLPRNP